MRELVAGDKRRYLLYIGYFGTRFSGCAREKSSKGLTVEKCISDALKSLEPCSRGRVTLSSRTDKGVHALCSAVHIDLSFKKRYLYNEGRLTYDMNKYFKSIPAEIQVLQAKHVPFSFEARHFAIERTYLYRLAISKPGADYSSANCAYPILPSCEINRAFLVRFPFDFEVAHKFCKLLEGKHDFASFSKYNRDFKSTIRTIDQFTLEPGKPLYNPIYDPLYEHMEFWNIIVRSRSFLYHQIRRSVAILISTATGHINPNVATDMMENPSHNNWPEELYPALPHGLYLVDVKYPPKVFEFHPMKDEQDLIEENIIEDSCSDILKNNNTN